MERADERLDRVGGNWMIRLMNETQERREEGEGEVLSLRMSGYVGNPNGNRMARFSGEA